MAVALNVGLAIAVLVLVASGLAVTFGLMGVVNFAHGDFIMVGAYVAVVTEGFLPFALTVASAGLAVALFAVPVECVLIRRLYRRPLDTILATYGLGLVMREGARIAAGGEYRSVAAPLPGTVELLGVTYPAYRLVVIAAAAAVFAALLATVRSEGIGTRVRAVIENPDLAASQGLDVDRTYTAGFAAGGALAGIAGALVSPLVSVHPDMGFDYIVDAFLALLTGGAGSIAGFGVTSSVIAGSDSLFVRYADPAFVGIVVLVIAVALMRIRPHGILAKR